MPARASRTATLSLIAALAALALTACGSASSSEAARWRPGPTTAAWQWQLQGKIDTSVPARVYEVDGFDVGKRVVRRLHREGRRVICYLDVGSWERYRPDRAAFPKRVIGRKYQGYPDERWLDIRRIDLLAKPLEARFDLCRRKGFDAVEPDNDNGFTNRTGFPLTAADQLRFNRWVARQVHRRGMSVALKNDPEQAPKLSPPLRLRGGRAVLPVPRVRPVLALREAGQGRVRGRVRDRAGQLLQTRRRAALQRDPQELRPAGSALDPLRTVIARTPGDE